MANTPIRNVRISDELWQRAKERASLEHCTLTDVVVDALRVYTDPATQGVPRQGYRVIEAPPRRGQRGTRHKADVVPTSPITGEHCRLHPKAIVKDGKCQTCRLEANRG